MKKLIVRCLSLGLAAALIIFLLSWLNVFGGVEQWTLDRRLQSKWKKTPKSDITIVLVQKKYREKVSRVHYVSLINEYYYRSGKIFGFDLVLHERNRDETVLFSTSSNFSDELDKGEFPEGLQRKFEEEFEKYGIRLFGPFSVSLGNKTNDKTNEWYITDERAEQTYIIERKWDKLNIYVENKLEDIQLETISSLAKVYYVFGKLQDGVIKYSDDERQGRVEVLEEKSQKSKWTWEMIHPKDKDLLFSIELVFQNDLDNQVISEHLRQEFENNQILLSQNVMVSPEEANNKWLITDLDNGREYFVRKEKDQLNIYGIKLERLGRDEIIAPLPGFSKAAKRIGHGHTVTLPTKVLRKFPLLIEYEGHVYPVLSLQIACDYLGITHKEVRLGKHIKLQRKNEKGKVEKNLEIPIDEKGFMYINYVGPFEKFESYSLNQMLEKKRNVGRIILIGAMIEEKEQSREDEHPTEKKKQPREDEHLTPFGFYPGVGIHANILQNILQRDFLYRKGALTHIWISLILQFESF